MQACAAQNIRGPRHQSRNKAIGETELAAERDGRALLCQQCIGSAVNDPPIESIGTNDTTDPLGRFDEQNVDTTPPQFVGCRQTGDTSADDHNVALDHAGKLPPRSSMNELREHLDVFDRCGGKDAVAQIEDMSGSAGHTFQNVLGLIEHTPRWAE
jgi:hypothetical protein